MNVLSLCDGIATGRYVLEKLEIPVEKYYSCEIEPTAIKIAQKNFPDIIELGDLTKLDTSIIKEPIDLVMFGFCCQSLSITMSKTRQHLDGKSSIFWDCLRILKEINPKYFFVENVASMKDDCKEIISKELGVEAIYVNSNQFSSQDRERYYWTNIPHGDVTKEPQSPLVIKDIMETNVPEKYFYTCTYDFHGLDKKTCATLHISGHDILKRVTSPNFKCPTLTRCSGGNHQKKTWDNGRPRKLTPVEYERAQGLPDGYTKLGLSVSYFDSYDILINNSTYDTGEKDIICKNVKLGDVITPYQIEKQDYVTSIIYDLLDTEQLNFQKIQLKEMKNVKLKDVIDYNKQELDIALNTIKDLLDTEQLNFLKESVKNVSIAVDWQLHEKCVTSTIKIGKDMETLCIPIKLDNDQLKMGMKKLVENIRCNIEKSLPNYSVGNSCPMKLYITLIWINLITIKKIYMFVPKTNTPAYISSLINLQENLLSIKLSNLKMENITQMSQTARYNALGNGWTVPVIEWFFKGLTSSKI